MSGTNSLALTQIITGEEPYALTFSIPLSLEVITFETSHHSTNPCWLEMEDNGQRGPMPYFQTNGGYRIEWGTPFSPRGTKHLLRVVLLDDHNKIYGPPLAVTCTNPFNFGVNLFGRDRMWIHSGLAIKRAGYRIDIYDTNKNLLNSITGRAEAGVIDQTWDLRAADGLVRTDDEFDLNIFLWRIQAATNQEAADDMPIFTNPYPIRFIRGRLGQTSPPVRRGSLPMRARNYSGVFNLTGRENEDFRSRNQAVSLWGRVEARPGGAEIFR